MKVTGTLVKGNVSLSLNSGTMHDADIRANGILMGMTLNDLRNLHELIGAMLKLGEAE